MSGDTYDFLVKDAATTDLVAFGARWLPTLQANHGSTKRAAGVLEVAFPQSRRVYLLQLQLLEQLPDEVRLMFANPEVLKVHFGQDTGDEGRLRSSGCTPAEATLYDIQGACAVLTGVSAEAPGEELRSLSLSGAASEILEHEMNTDESIACSDWGSTELTLQQICFASMEAWVTLLLFRAVYAAQYPQEFAFDTEENTDEASGSPCQVSDEADIHLRSRRPRPSSDAPAAAAAACEVKEESQQRQGGKVLPLQRHYYVLLALGFAILAMVAFPMGKLLRLVS